jgi:hypothetical protein
MAKATNDEAPTVPPAPTCLLCQRTLEEVGGTRLINCTQSRGVLIGETADIGSFKKRKVFRLAQGGVLVLGDSDPWRWLPDEMERAREQAESGYHPWFCQACGARTCSTCGAPLRSPVGCTAMGADGTYGPYSPMLGARIPCTNPDCPSRPENR